MSKKDAFIKYVEGTLKNCEMDEDAKAYWEVFTATKETEKPPFTDNGKLVLNFMRDHIKDMPMGKARDIGEGLLISSRTISGTMRKLISDGYVEKIGENPSIYALTEKGKTVEIV